MSDSVEKFNETDQSRRINKSKVYEYTCFCTNSSNCTNCAKPKSYLVTQWVKKFDDDEKVLFRFDNRSLDYVVGFAEGLGTNPKTQNVIIDEIEE